MGKRLRVHGTVLRARPLEEKAALTQQFVSRVLPLRAHLAAILGLAAALLVSVVWREGTREGLASALVSDLGFGGVFLGVAVAAPAAALAALAASRPGREALQRGATGAAVVGLLLATLVAGGLLLVEGVDAGSPAMKDPMCFQRVLLFAVLPFAAILFLELRGWVHAALPAAALALLGAGALGACVAHVTCGAIGGRHLVVGHVLPLYLLVGLGALPLGSLLRRVGGR